MSSLESIDKVFFNFKKFLGPTVLLAIGFILLYFGMRTDLYELNNGEILEVQQDGIFKVCAVLIILTGIIWLLYILDLIKSFVGMIVMVVMLAGSAYILFKDFDTVRDDVVFNTSYDERAIEIITRMHDLKSAEQAYRETNGHFTDSMDDLIDYVKNGKKMDIFKKGSIPERKISESERDMLYGDNRPIDNLMTEWEATMIARNNDNTLDGNEFRRDTNMVPVMDALFNTLRYKTQRSKIGGELAFHPDSMRYVPFTQNLTELDTGTKMKDSLAVPTLLIKMTHPMEHPIKGYVDYTIGSKEENHLRDNWSDIK